MLLTEKQLIESIVPQRLLWLICPCLAGALLLLNSVDEGNI